MLRTRITSAYFHQCEQRSIRKKEEIGISFLNEQDEEPRRRCHRTRQASRKKSFALSPQRWHIRRNVFACMTALVYQRLHRFVNLQYFFTEKDEAFEHTHSRHSLNTSGPRRSIAMDVSTDDTDRCDALHGAYLVD